MISSTMIDGDVESNTCTFDNNMVTPKSKGRPKKNSKKTFNFMKPKKLDFTTAEKGSLNFETLDTNMLINNDSADPLDSGTTVENRIDSVNDSAMPLCEYIPLPLKNLANVCFFNAVVQVFHSLLPFRARVFSDLVDNHIISSLRLLFREIESSPIYEIDTYPIVRALQIPDYIDREQIDAREVVSHLIDNSVEWNQITNERNETRNVPDYAFFKLTEIRSIICSHCNKESSTTADVPLIQLNVDAFESQTIGNLLDREFNVHGSPIAEYRCEVVRDDEGREILDENGNVQGCDLRGHCNQAKSLSVQGDFMIIILKIFLQDTVTGRTRLKIFPDVIIDPELHVFDKFELQGIIWHHGPSYDSGHYTSNVKSNGIWYHTNDTAITQKEMFRTVGEQVPYIVIYQKRNCNVLLCRNELKIETCINETVEVHMDSTPTHDSNSTWIEFSDDEIIRPTKRTCALSVGNVDNNDVTPAKKSASDENLVGEEEMIVEDTSFSNMNKCANEVDIVESVEIAKDTRYNFSKKKPRFLTNRQRFLNSPQGKKLKQEAANRRRERQLSTPEGLKKHQGNARKGMQTKRAKEKADKEEHIRTLPFPPEIDDKTERDCIKNFINAISPESIETLECGVCGMTVRKSQCEIKPVVELDNYQLLSTERQENSDNLEEYVFDIEVDNLKLLLSPGGVHENRDVVCCKVCLSSLKKNRLPKFSIANNFQIGKSPPELSELTLPEKLLISKYRPKMYLVKLRSVGGSQAQQRGLKGNTITFPQDIVKIATTLPANPDILTDHLRVVFIGKSKPTPEMLKKVLTVRREKVYDALNFLLFNNPEYADVTISSNLDLPTDDIPKEIMQTLGIDEDVDEEDANEHSTYTPQTDLDDIPRGTFLIDSVGMVDLDGSTVKSSDQLTSAVLQLQGNSMNEEANSGPSYQGTLIVPHGSVPVCEYNNPGLWLGAYPWLFPYGKGGPEVRRSPNVGLRAYIKHLLQLADRKFSLDLSFKFHAFNVIQKRDVSYHTSLHVKRPGFSSTASRINSLNQESMTELLKCIENKTPITDPNLRSLMDSLSSAGKHINGSPYQKSTYRREIYGLMIELGSPVLWITLSPAVTHSPLFLQIAGHKVDLSNIPSHVERAIHVANDPVAAAIYYNLVLDAFVRFLLGHEQHDGGCFGHPSAYYGMTEEQGTGTLHNHMLVWLHNSVSISKLKEELKDEKFRKKLADYLERIIKQGYLGANDADDDELIAQNLQDLDVSEVSFKYPIELDDPQFSNDVNELVTVANTHSCRATCYKYRKAKDQCRFEYPREIVQNTEIEGNKIKLKRTNEMINNYNPAVMTCIRSNHDVKFVPGSKDGKNIAFYATNYATKDQLSTHNMVPLIAASKQRVDEDTTMASNSMDSRAKAMITKCLNKITTETELSGSHVSHFLLGYKDNKTSHKFVGLSLHSALLWLANAIKEYDNLDDGTFISEENRNEIVNNPDNAANSDDSDDDEDNDNEDDGEEIPSYTLSTGNNGLVLIDQMTDYINRGQALTNMCLWEYRSRVYKKKFTDEELKKHNKKTGRKKSRRECEETHRFSSNHPQSETHWQRVRIKDSKMIPTLSRLPPSSITNKLRYQKCILLLFKPFTRFEELYNGISWEETYSAFYESTENRRYIENLEDFLKGIEEESETNKENDDQARENFNEEGEDITQLEEADDTSLDSRTTEALQIIRNTPWLDESISNHRIEGRGQPLFDRGSVSLLPPSETWKADIEKQNKDKLDNTDVCESEIEDNPSLTQFSVLDGNENADVDFTIAAVDVEQEHERIKRIGEEIVSEKTLNKKQEKGFEIATNNIIKRHFKEKTEQLIAYIGGPGGTGKSQLIKAIVEFHEKMKARHTLKLCAYTGTAAKHIGGSTTSTLFSITLKGRKDASKLQRRFEKVETIIIDEVSMIGCDQLVKIHKALCKAKCVPSSVPFGGVDMIFFGDFVQFPPVKDSPLYCGWDKTNKKSKRRKTEITKMMGTNLWKQVNKVLLLDQQMRCTDPRYLELLNRLREGKCTKSDAALLQTRVVGQNVDITSMKDTPIIVPGNQLVMAINNQFIACHSQYTKVYVSNAQDYIGRKKNKKAVPKKVARKIKHLANTSTRGLPSELQLFVGMPIMVTNNIATELGITNGTLGKVRLIHLKNGEAITGDTGYHQIEHPLDYVIVELEDVSIRPLVGLPPNHVPISVKTESFSLKMPDTNKSISVNRSHFPLVPFFSCTGHKSQGKTLRKAIVDLIPIHGSTKKVGIEFAYVPLSRVRRLQDLTILRPFDPSILNAKVNEGCAAMMEEYKRRDIGKDL